MGFFSFFIVMNSLNMSVNSSILRFNQEYTCLNQKLMDFY